MGESQFTLNNISFTFSHCASVKGFAIAFLAIASNDHSVLVPNYGFPPNLPGHN
jgi:hypothetical protein